MSTLSDGDIVRRALECADNDAHDALERLEALADAGEHLYLQCHNMKTVGPRWANDGVCEAMRHFGKVWEKKK